MVSRLASIRAGSWITPSAIGTLKSHRTSTFLFWNSRCVIGWTGIAGQFHSLRLKLIRHESGDIREPVRVAPFVVVPRKYLDHPLADDLGQGRVENRRMRIAVEIDRDQRRLGVSDNALERAFGRRLHRRVDR